MGYRGNRGVEFLDRATRRMTQTSEGADLLSRWLIYGFAILVLALAWLGVWFSAMGGTFGDSVTFFAAFLGLMINFGFHRSLLFSNTRDEREAIIAWKAIGWAALLVASAFSIWAIANGLPVKELMWTPTSEDEWKALGFAAVATLLALTSAAIVWLTPPYVAESDEEFY